MRPPLDMAMFNRLFTGTIVALSLLAASAHDTLAQPEKVRRVGILSAAAARSAPHYIAFERRLSELGYIEGRNLAIDFRSGEGLAERLPELAAELVRANPDVILAVGSDPLMKAVRQATHGITPVVMMAVDFDPVATGDIASLARPGGNVTGIFFRQPELAAKRLELLKEAVPDAAVIAVLWDAVSSEQLRATQAIAGVLAVRLEPIGLGEPPYDYDAAFAAAARVGGGAVLVPLSPMLFRDRDRLAEAARRSRLPAMFAARELAEAGGLMTYGANLAEQLPRAAQYVDKILKGANPGELPVELAATFELVINTGTAKALGFAVPPAIIARADEVIE